MAVERTPDQLNRGRGPHAGKGKRQLWLDLALMRRHEKRGGSVFEGKQVCEEVIRTLWQAQHRLTQTSTHTHTCKQINLQIPLAETVHSTSTLNWNGIPSNNWACTGASLNSFCSPLHYKKTDRQTDEDLRYEKKLKSGMKMMRKGKKMGERLIWAANTVINTSRLERMCV